MHVLLATDGSDLALEATKHGLTLLGDATKITMLSVVTDLAADTGGGIEGPIYTPAQEEEIRIAESEHATHSLSATEVIVKSIVDPSVVVERNVDTGDPAARICAVAEDLKTDVIVIGSHGKGFVSRMFLGSVSEHVVRHAPCPVLVVRALDNES